MAKAEISVKVLDLPEVKAFVGELRDLLAELVDPDDCAIDSHGYCEAHGYVTKSRCPHARAKVLLGLTETAADHGPLTEVLPNGD